MKRVLTVIGARPQFVKAAAVSKKLRDVGIPEEIVHTGQHYDKNMSDVFFEELGIDAPAVNLQVGSGGHGQQTAAMLSALESIMSSSRPEIVLVYGDTNSTLAGALAAAKLQIPIAHVEAGLRSFNRAMPEEINRVLTDHLSTILFTPTQVADDNLRAEGIAGAKVVRVGDVMLDAWDAARELAIRRTHIFSDLNLRNSEYVLATIHRAENTDNPERLDAIMSALRALSKEIPVVLPLHPRTSKILGDQTSTNVRLLEPVGYLDMIALESRARLIVTDSGGVQKEAFFARVPCVTVRAETEWVELLESGWNRLAPPTSSATVLSEIRAALDTQEIPHQPLYGDGTAAVRIAAELATRIQWA